MVMIYKKKQFKVYAECKSDEVIIHNSNKPFDKGHTHIRNFKTAKYLIDLSIHKSIPNHPIRYFITSLIRLTDDKVYKEALIRELHKLKKRWIYSSLLNFCLIIYYSTVLDINMYS